MSAHSDRRGGGLRLPAGHVARPLGAAASAGGDASWLSDVETGDDQGRWSACTMFALASLCRIMTANEIGWRYVTDEMALDAYRRTIARLGKPDAGLTPDEAFDGAVREEWVPPESRLEQVYCFETLPIRPILTAYTITPAWQRVSAQGCLDHSAPDDDLGAHMTLCVAHGRVERLATRPLVYIDNSWGMGWGWRGLCVMEEELHNRTCLGMWRITR